MEDLPNASGIYKITCVVTGKFYIGSTVNLHKRCYEHLRRLQRNTHSNRKLQNAWNKYGKQSFIIEVLEYVLPMSLTAREQYWLNSLKPFGRKGFNLAYDANAPMIGREVTSKTRAKIGQASRGRFFSPEAREKIGQASRGRKTNLGKKASPEAREKMRQSHLGKKQSSEHIEKRVKGHIGKHYNLGKKHTSETIEKIRVAKMGHKHTPETIEKIRQTKLARKIGA